MKTVLLSPTFLKKPQQQIQTSSKHITHKNMINQGKQKKKQIRTIADIIGSKKLRQTNNIFYIKFNDNRETINCQQQRKTFCAVQQNYSSLRINKNNAGDQKILSARNKIHQIGQNANKKHQQLIFPSLNIYNPNNANLNIQLRQHNLLNTEFQFFKAFNRYHKNIVQKQHRNLSFDTSIITKQTKFHSKKAGVAFSTRRSLSVNAKGNKQIVNTIYNQDLQGKKKLIQVKQTKKQNFIKFSKKQKISQRLDRHLSPWGFIIQQLQKQKQ